MTTEKCYFCYLPLAGEAGHFHAKCSRKIFGTPEPPEFNFTPELINELAKEFLGRHKGITGVQPKLSLDEERSSGKKRRLTVVGLWGKYVFKPPVKMYPGVTANEDLTMRLAEMSGIRTAEHSLVPFAADEPAYISPRFDRESGIKLHMEDMAQLSEVSTSRKYRSSLEKVGKLIKKYSDQVGDDLMRFYELNLFCFLTGNSDMHLKNFSLICDSRNEIRLSPAYDLLNTKLLIPDDTEEFALTMNGKKSRFKMEDFAVFAESLSVSPKQQQTIHEQFYSHRDQWKEVIGRSFLPEWQKDGYLEIVNERFKRLFP
ncbi:MAG: hypothetical protein HBSAPP04_20450 [Ignavibacteriaceae bacterium]|nr:MAG: type II toxin-antitoxin system HipA family toxin [Chlorobiota bacterium]GJQ33206.1 MAG: hypothetical protein HBSAPP04_20450 [Ignavibacteriaceae bacterium]